jgi:multiple sugar transport system substrate-binding protein
MAGRSPRSRVSRRAFLASATAASAAVLVAACAPAAPSTPTPAPAKPAAPTEAPKPAAAAQGAPATAPAKPAEATKPAVAPAAAKPAAGGARVKLTLMHHNPDPDETMKAEKPGSFNYYTAENWKKVRDLFVERNPNVELSDIFGAWPSELRTKQQVAITGGNPPDTITSEWAAEFGGLGFVEDVDLKGMGLDGKIHEGSLEGYTWKGKVYGVAQWAHPLGMFRNTKLHKDAGVNVDKHPETWAEWEEVATRLTNPAKNIHGTIIAGSGDAFGGQMRYAPFVWGLGGDFFDKEFTKAVWDSPPGIEAIEFLSRMSKKTAPPGSASAVRKIHEDSFLAGQIGYFVHSAGFSSRVVESGFEFAVGGFPVKPGGKQSSTLVGNIGWSVSKGAKNRDLGMKWVQHNGTAEVQRIYTAQAQRFPVNKDAWDQTWLKEHPIMSQFFPIFARGENHPLPTTPVADGEIKKVFEMALEEALIGTNPAEVWRKSAAQATALLQKK